jgi:hypothetical protein
LHDGLQAIFHGRQTVTRISAADGDTIRVARVLCIFFMISVHLPPASSAASIIDSGPLELIGTFWVGGLGRASVSTLSFISGYLMVGALGTGSKAALIRRRAQVLLAPMLTWNALYLALVAGAAMVGLENAAADGFGRAGPLGMLNAVTGLAGPTANLSLFFLRDLFVSGAVIAIFWPVVRMAPTAALICVLAAALLIDAEPVIFRMTIPLFMLAGCVARARGIPLSDLATPRVAIPAVLVCLFAYLLVERTAAAAGPGADLANILKRAGLVFLSLAVAARLVGSRFLRLFRLFEPTVYLAYLSHVIVFSVLWQGLRALTGVGPLDVSYLAFFGLAPVFAIALSPVLGVVFDRFPAPVRLALTGRSGTGQGWRSRGNAERMSPSV